MFFSLIQQNKTMDSASSSSSSLQTPSWWPWAARGRIFKNFWHGLSDPSNTFTLAVSAFSVFSIAFTEAMLRSDPTHKLRWRFCARYAQSQMLPSIIWLTTDPKLFAHKFKCPTSGKTPLIDDASPLLRSSTKRRIFFLSCLRSVIFGFVGISQILRSVEIASEEAANYRERVLTGKEPLMSGIGTENSNNTKTSGRVIRLAGQTSDVTELSLSRYGHHIIPIFEDPCLKSVKRLMEKYTKNGVLPLGWKIEVGEYGIESSWEGFEVEKEWLFSVSKKQNQDKQKKSLLIIEADSSVGEQSLALGSEINNDLTISDASQGFRMLGELLKKKIVGNTVVESNNNNFSTLRVVLADLRAPIKSGGGGSVSCREFIEQRQLADVLLDAQAPLILAILKWANNADGQKGKKRMIFDTSNEEYFQTVSKWMKPSGWEVLDRHAINCARSREIPRLVYERTTHETVHSAFALLRADLVASDKICVLLDNAKGIDQMNTSLKQFTSSSSYGGGEISRVCSSELYDDMFSEVRRLAVEDGKDFSEIQSFVDGKFNEM